MKSFLIAATAALTLGVASQASAADLAPRPYTKAPPMIAAVYDWTGFYVGANGGYGSARNCWNLTQNGVAPVNPGSPQGCNNANGATAGGQVGYRWQATNWVFGVEAQGNWADFRGSNLNTSPLLAGLFNDNTRVRSFGLFTGQLGYAWNNSLLYVKGGAAVIDARYFYSLTAPLAGLATGTVINNSRETRWGATVGAGIEYGFAPNWSIAFDYSHVFMSDRSLTFNLVPPVPNAGAVSAVSTISQDLDIGTVRVNYKFGGPVVARY